MRHAFAQRISRSRRSLIGLVVLGVALVTLGASCGGADQTPPTAFDLTVWRSEDQDDDFELAIEAYQAVYPHVSVEVRVFKQEEYEEALFNAWAKGQGPDVISIPNTKVGRFQEFLAAAPETLSLKTTHIEKSFGKSTTVVDTRSVQLPTPLQVKDLFVNTVYNDVVLDGKIYGLPLSMDTLVLYYNYDLLAKAQVAVPPKTWVQFRDDVQLMRVLDEQKTIVRPAAAFGTADNVPHFFDLVSVLMMQNGTTMVTDNNRVAFTEDSVSGKQQPALEALDFYVKFSDPNFKTYTWNDEQQDALELFTQGQLGFYFGYYSDLATIKQRSPNLNFSYSEIPQIDPSNPVNYPQYSVEAVPLTSQHQEHAWNFITFMAAQEQVSTFLSNTERIPALRTLVAEVQQDPTVGVFARQALTAQSWYHGYDHDAAVVAFQSLINELRAKSAEPEEILAITASKVRLTFEQQTE